MAPQPPASTFPQDLPPREQSWKDRNCPGMTGYFSFRLSSYSLQTSDKAVLARRVCMLTILLLRTAISVKEVVWAAIRLNIAWLIINIVFGIISFFFVAMALEKIGEAQGRRKVLGILVVCSSAILVDVYITDSYRGGGTLMSSYLSWPSSTQASSSVCSSALVGEAGVLAGWPYGCSYSSFTGSRRGNLRPKAMYEKQHPT